MDAPTRPILVPLDGSADAEAALVVAVPLARALPAPLRFIRVDPPVRTSSADLVARTQTFNAYAATLLHARRGLPVPFDTRIRTGEAATVIVDEAQDALLVVIASHGLGGIRLMFNGSVAEQVARSASVPTLVVPTAGPTRPIDGPILVALDGSDLAEKVLPLARSLAAATRQPLVLLRAWSPGGTFAGEFMAAPSVVTAMADSAREYLESVRQPGEEAVVTPGPPITAVRLAADRLDASLVIVASHGKGRALRLALGSTSEGLRRSLRRPLLIVPARSAATSREDEAELPAAV